MIASFVALLMLVPSVAYGDASEPDRRAVVDLHVNAETRGVIIALMRDSDILVRTQDLKEAGLVRIGGTRYTIGADEYVSLQSLDRELHFALDSVAVVLDLTVVPEYLSASKFDTGSGDEPSVVTRAHSGFLNYAYDSSATGSQALSGELGISLGAGMLTSTAAAGGATAGGRLRTSWTFDDPNRATRLVIGDVLSDNTDFSGLGGHVALMGVSFGHEPSIDSTGIYRQHGTLSGTVRTATKAELYVNGVLTREENIPPGPFTFVNFPLQVGSNNAELVLRDAFGRETRYRSVLFAASSLLSRNTRDFSIAVGRPTGANPAGSSGGFGVIGHYRYGVRDDLSVGTTLEHSRLGSNVGASVGVGAGRFGQFDFEIAASNGAPRNGYAAVDDVISLSDASRLTNANTTPARYSLLASHLAGTGESFAWSLPGRTVSLQAELGFRSPFYSNITTAVNDDRAVRESNAAVGIAVGRTTNLTLNYRSSSYRDAAPRSELMVTEGVSLGHRAGLLTFAEGMRRSNGSSAPVFRVEYSAYRKGTQYVARSESEGGSTTRSIEISHPLSLGETGFGYCFARNSYDTASSYVNEVDYNGKNFVATATGTLSRGRFEPGVRVAGALAFVDGTFAFTRPIQSSFALVDLNGLSGVRATVNDRTIGATDRHGRIIATDLTEYRANRFQVDGTDAPADYLIESDRQSATPSHLGGVHVRFPGRRIVAYTGTISVRGIDGTVVAGDGRLTLRRADQETRTDLGTGGRFYLEDVTSGVYDASLISTAGTCTFKLTVVKPEGPVTPLGEVRCTDTVPNKTTSTDSSQLRNAPVPPGAYASR